MRPSLARRLACRLVVLALPVFPLTGASAAPLSKTADFDFFRDVPSRSLEGFAARSDGRLVRGPFVRDLTATLPADLLWTHLPLAADRWLVGGGPDGQILELTLDGETLTARAWASLPATHVFALARLADGSVLAGTSPQGTLTLLRDGQVIATAALPVDSLFDFLVQPDGSVLIATGNPGRLYRLDVATFARTALPASTPTTPPPAAPPPAETSSAAPAASPAPSAEPAATPPVPAAEPPPAPILTLATEAELAAHGLTFLGEVRDTNLRRLARLPDGRIAAGSAPRGNIYVFPAPASAAPASPPAAPRLLVENRDAEVVDLLVEPDGTLYAALTFATTPVSARLGRSGNPAPGASASGGSSSSSGSGGSGSGDDAAPSAAVSGPALSLTATTPSDASRTERFPGRGALVVIPPAGLPETVSLRAGAAFYRLARHGDWFLIAAGESGDLLGYDPVARRSLTFPGTASAQLNDLAPIPGQPGRFTALRNNPAGLALVDFTAAGPRRAETRKLDLATSARLGAVQFGRFRGSPAPSVALRASFASDDLEGWTDWVPAPATDGGFTAPDLHGRYVRARVTAPAEISADWQLDAGTLHHLPDNRRPVLTSYRVLPPGYALRPPTEARPTAGPTTLGQLLGTSGNNSSDSSAGSGSEAAERAARNAFLGSQLLPVPDQLIVTWSLQDSDGDVLAATFSLRREGEDAWRDLVVDARLPYAQLDLSTLADGVYFTRLVVQEQAPRPAAERLAVTFETDDLIVDRTPPRLETPKLERLPDRFRVTVTATDERSLLAGAGFEFNHGVTEILEQPADGILDGRTETFVLELPLARVATATAVQITVEDTAGNPATVRVEF